MSSRLTDEEVWLECYCAEVFRLDTVGPLAGELADSGLYEFRKRFPVETGSAEPELVVEWRDCKAYCRGYDMFVYWMPGHEWHWEVTNNNGRFFGGKDLKTCDKSKAAAEAALRKELGK